MDETDLFFNLRLGELILGSGRVPTENLLSFTCPHATDINLAWLFQHGYGVKADLEKAVHYYTESAALGYSSAQCNLGYLYYHGLGVLKDLPKACNLFRRAVAAENARRTPPIRATAPTLMQPHHYKAGSRTPEDS